MKSNVLKVSRKHVYYFTSTHSIAAQSVLMKPVNDDNNNSNANDFVTSDFTGMASSDLSGASELEGSSEEDSSAPSTPCSPDSYSHQTLPSYQSAFPQYAGQPEIFCYFKLMLFNLYYIFTDKLIVGVKKFYALVFKFTF